MSDVRLYQIQRISAHPGPVPGRGTQRAVEVCKYVDVTTCIGCKACEVACVEWNDHPFRETTFDDTYQTMPETDWNYWNLIKFVEHIDALVLQLLDLLRVVDDVAQRRHPRAAIGGRVDDLQSTLHPKAEAHLIGEEDLEPAHALTLLLAAHIA